MYLSYIVAISYKVAVRVEKSVHCLFEAFTHYIIRDVMANAFVL